jgi:hypothetical protein
LKPSIQVAEDIRRVVEMPIECPAGFQEVIHDQRDVKRGVEFGNIHVAGLAVVIGKHGRVTPSGRLIRHHARLTTESGWLTPAAT